MDGRNLLLLFGIGIPDEYPITPRLVNKRQRLASIEILSLDPVRAA